MTTTWRCSSGSVASASRRSSARSRAESSSPPWPCSSRTSSQGIARRWRMWSTATLRATRMIHAENGTSRGSYFGELRHQLREHVLRDVFGLEVVAHDARHVAVHVIRVAHVEEAERFAITLLRADDRLIHRAI